MAVAMPHSRTRTLLEAALKGLLAGVETSPIVKGLGTFVSELASRSEDLPGHQKDALEHATLDDIKDALADLDSVTINAAFAAAGIAQVEDLVGPLARAFHRQRAVRGILWANIGNARFLHALQQADDAPWFNLNIDNDLRDRYLEMLDELARTEWSNNDPTFTLHMLDGLVVFLDAYDAFRSIYRTTEAKPRSAPFIAQGTRLVEHLSRTRRRESSRGNANHPRPLAPTKQRLHSLQGRTHPVA